MIVKNKKNGTNVLVYKNDAQIVRVTIRAGEQVTIQELTEFEQVINKADFQSRGWFEVVEEIKKTSEVKETSLEKAEKEVREYISEA